MLLAHIKDMSPEEILSIFSPILYLVPITVVAILVFVGIKIYGMFAVQRMLSYMRGGGKSEDEKREYLKNYLMRTSNGDLIKHRRNCPVCGKKYSLKIFSVNSRGDTVESWNHDGCPHCHTKVVTLPEQDNKKYLTIERRPSSSPEESRYREVFKGLIGFIEFYQPYIDCSQGPSDDTVTVEISFR